MLSLQHNFEDLTAGLYCLCKFKRTGSNLKLSKHLIKYSTLEAINQFLNNLIDVYIILNKDKLTISGNLKFAGIAKEIVPL